MPAGAVVASIAGGAMQASAAKKAASAQTNAAKNDIAFQKETRDIIRGDLADYRTGGNNALDAYLFEMGLADRPTFGGTPLSIEEFTEGGGNVLEGAMGGDGVWSVGGAPGVTKFRVGDQVFGTREEAQAYATANGTQGSEYQGFKATPGYQFQLEQGQDSINALAGARGGLLSGRTLQDLSQFNQGLANQEYGGYMSRLGGLVDTGMSASQMSGQASQNAAAGVSNAYGNIGNAGAASAIAQGNAWTGALSNLTGVFQYQNALKNYNPYNPATGGGNWWNGTR